MSQPMDRGERISVRTASLVAGASMIASPRTPTALTASSQLMRHMTPILSIMPFAPAPPCILTRNWNAG